MLCSAILYNTYCAILYTIHPLYLLSLSLSLPFSLTLSLSLSRTLGANSPCNIMPFLIRACMYVYALGCQKRIVSRNKFLSVLHRTKVRSTPHANTPCKAHIEHIFTIFSISSHIPHSRQVS